jgi:uncharacterized protein YbjT (DUF2867 family)
MDGGSGGRVALLVGATGLVGGHCLDLLLGDASYARVIALTRRPLARTHAKLDARVVDFDRLGETAGDVAADDVFCCLGTTIRAAGSQEAFRRVDFAYPVETARLAAANGARRFLIVTAMGANARSRIFYNRVKGEVEAAVRAMAFESVVILRPSLLLGERAERRAGEETGKRVMSVVGPLLVGPLRKYRGIEGGTVARAMVRLAKVAGPGVCIVESDEIARLGA